MTGKRDGLLFRSRNGVPGTIRDRALGYLIAGAILLAGLIVAFVTGRQAAGGVLAVAVVIWTVTVLYDMSRDR